MTDRRCKGEAPETSGVIGGFSTGGAGSTGTGVEYGRGRLPQTCKGVQLRATVAHVDDVLLAKYSSFVSSDFSISIPWRARPVN